MYFLPVFPHNDFARAHTRIYLSKRGLDKERMQRTPFLFLAFREAGADWGERLDSSGNRGTSRWDGGLAGSSSKALGCFSGAQLRSLLPLTASTNACAQSWVWCWGTLSLFFCGFVVVHFCVELLYFIHRHIRALSSWAAALQWTKGVSPALRISVRLSAGGGLSSQAAFQKCLNQELALLTRCGKWLCTSVPCTVFRNFLPVSPWFRANLHLVYGAEVSVILITPSQPCPWQAFIFQPLLMPCIINLIRVCVFFKEAPWLFWCQWDANQS